MKKVIIMGAAGRDFHNFNTYFRDNPNFQVVAFTATQIPTSKAANIRPSWPESSIRTASPSTPRKSSTRSSANST